MIEKGKISGERGLVEQADRKTKKTKSQNEMRLRGWLVEI